MFSFMSKSNQKHKVSIDDTTPTCRKSKESNCQMKIFLLIRGTKKFFTFPYMNFLTHGG